MIQIVWLIYLLLKALKLLIHEWRWHSKSPIHHSLELPLKWL